MKLIELHILQSFPVSCLNRDDVGAPKTAIFGGCTRARISSQCLKRAVRLLAHELNDYMYRGSRTRKAAEALASELIKLQWQKDEAEKVAQEVLESLLSEGGAKMKKKGQAATNEKDRDRLKTSTLLFFSPQEIQKIAKSIANNPKAKDDTKSLKDLILKALGKGLPLDAADIAIFGRMVAAAPELTLEGAGMFSHALSTHSCENDLDFWTAVDDEKTMAEDAGAGNMGTAEFTSACYYRYAAVNLDLLADPDHLGAFKQEERQSIMNAFVRATLMAVPGARKNSMNAHTLPNFVLGLYRDHGQPLQLINAFETPVRGRNGLIAGSIEVLKRHYEDMKKTWSLPVAEEVSIPETTLDEFCQRLIQHVP